MLIGDVQFSKEEIVNYIQNLPPRDMECPRGDAVGVAVFGWREPRVPVPAGVPAVFESRKCTGTAGESVYF